MHGLRGHPRSTWEDSYEPSSKGEDGASSKRKTFKSFFKAKPSISTTDGNKNEESSAPRRIFWPKDYLTQDIPQARVWTYGYNADVIGGLFQANNKNSVSQHGRDLAVRVEREIENEVALYFTAWGRTVRLTTTIGPNLIRSSQPRRYYCQRRKTPAPVIMEVNRYVMLTLSHRRCIDLRHADCERV